MLLLEKAAAHNYRFNVFVTESRPGCQSAKVSRRLKELGIPCQIVLDAAVGYYMDRMHMVLVGAEGVVENGGIINQVGKQVTAVYFMCFP
jgi:translation initiation factor eIF-2B subunit alpha